MRRTKLIWLAIGLAIGVTLPWIAKGLFPKPMPPTLYVTISEPLDAEEPPAQLASAEQTKIDEYRGAALAKSCGINQFQVTMPTHRGAQTDVELASSHENALDCLVEKAPAQGMALRFKRTPAV